MTSRIYERGEEVGRIVIAGQLYYTNQESIRICLAFSRLAQRQKVQFSTADRYGRPPPSQRKSQRVVKHFRAQNAHTTHTEPPISIGGEFSSEPVLLKETENEIHSSFLV